MTRDPLNLLAPGERDRVDGSPNPVFIDNPDGSGDLAFGAIPSFWDTIGRRRRFWNVNRRLDRTDRYRLMMMWGYDPLVPPRLRDIPDVADVAELIRATQNAARAT